MNSTVVSVALMIESPSQSVSVGETRDGLVSECQL